MTNHNVVNNKLVVYTALFGDYDDLIVSGDDCCNVDFLFFTEQLSLKTGVGYLVGFMWWYFTFNDEPPL